MASCKGYEVVRPIGAGSFGQVFLVLHTVEQRHYVMKEIASMADMDDKQRESTDLEVKLLSAISHPNIVGFQDSFINEGGHLAIFMEYCEQGDMYTYLQDAKKTGRIPGEAKLLEWFVQVILALQALHSRRVLHRDLKMQNIFLTGSRDQHAMTLKLGDFGIAKVLNNTTELAKTQIGTPFYMSPECFNSKPYGYKSDVWGLGCVLYELVNGQRPFEAQSINGLAMKVMQGRYTPITASCTEETRWLIKSMLSNNPAHRPTLQELLYTPCVRRCIKQALQTVTTAGTPEAHAEVILTQQLASLGLGGLVDCPDGAEPRGDRRQLQQKLERAERRRKREEETLRRLQETAAHLAHCLSSSSSTSHLSLLTSRPPDLGLTDTGQSWYSAVGPNSARGEGFPEDCPPAMSHRDRILKRKERRREEEEQKFEEEARKIREENLAHQRTWMQESQRYRVPTKDHFRSADVNNVHQQQQQPHPQHVMPQLPIGSNTAHNMPLAPIQGHDHIKPSNGANPFQSRHPHVAHTPRNRQRFESEPAPPIPQFGRSHRQEPPPPHEAPHPRSGRWSQFARSDAAQPFQTSRSLHSVTSRSQRLSSGAISSDGFETLPEHSEDSGSANHSDDALPEFGRKSLGTDEQVRRHSLVVQQRIDACRAAICRHKMTIETLQYNCAQEAQPDDQLTVRDYTSEAHHGSELTPQLRDRSPTKTFSVRAGVTPAIVLDRIARLKRRCLEGLGEELFQATCQCLQTLTDSGEMSGAVRSAMLNKLGSEKIGFYSLIDQIVYMECRWGHIDAVPPELA